MKNFAFKGTPGPWEVLDQDGEITIIQKDSLRNHKGFTIYTPVTEELSKKDAKMIAAAPEMFDLLKLVMDYQRMIGFRFDDYPEDHPFRKALLLMEEITGEKYKGGDLTGGLFFG